MATRDIRDYGARVDGSTDDTDAVMDAIAAASTGDTIYFPPGTTRVYASVGAAIDLDDTIPDDLTLAGAGESTVVKMLPRSSEHIAWVIGVDGNDGPVRGLTIRDMVLDGNRAHTPRYSTMGFNLFPGGSGHDITIRDVRAQNSSESGFTLQGGYIEVVDCTAINNGRQGFGIKPRTDTGEPEVVLNNVLTVDNGKSGIDHNNGYAVIDGFWSENNAAGGAKVPWPATESVWRNGTFKSNGTMGFRYNGDYRDQTFRPFPIRLDNVVAEDNPWAGFWLAGDVTYDIGTIAARRNNSSGRQSSNIEVLSYADVDADTIYSSDATGAGMYYSSDRHSVIRDYHVSGNRDGRLAGDQLSNLSIDSTHSSVAELNVPSRDEVGAWSSPSSTTSADGSLQTAAGTLQADTGALQMR